MLPLTCTKQTSQRWWTGRVLLQATYPARLTAGEDINPWCTQVCDGVEQLLGMPNMGLWLRARADVAHGHRTVSWDSRTARCSDVPAGLLKIVDFAQARGMGVLMDLPTDATGAMAWACSLRTAELEPQSLVHEAMPSAPALHARLSCAMKHGTRRLPAWLLSGSGGALCAPETHDQRQARLAIALLMSVIGTPIIAMNSLPNTPTWPSAYAGWMLWRSSHAALVQGSMKLLPVHGQLLAFIREFHASKVLCVMNWSDRYVREPLPANMAGARLLPGSGLRGGRVIDHHIDCDPWGGLFAAWV